MTAGHPLGIQLYSVRDDLGPERLDATLARLAALGFTHAEPYDILSDPHALAAALRRSGLRATTAHASVIRHEETAVLDAAEVLGIGTVTAAGQRPRAERTVGSGPDAGTRFPVEVPTHVSVVTTFASGVVGTSVYSFDSSVRRQLFEVTGADGVLEVPVSGFDGPTRLLTGIAVDTPWRSVPAAGTPRGRGVGVLEMARAVRVGERPRASGELAYHVLDVMIAIEESIGAGAPVRIESTAPPVPPIPPHWDPTTPTTDGTEQ